MASLTYRLSIDGTWPGSEGNAYWVKDDDGR